MNPSQPKKNPKEIPLLEGNELLKVPLRFNIMFLLYNYNRMGFTRMQSILHCTAGNLDYHLKILGKAEWIVDTVEFSPRPLKFFRITTLGTREFSQYTRQLQRILDNLPDKTTHD